MSKAIDKVTRLEMEVECLRDEIRSLKLDQRAKDQELDAARQELQTLQQKARQEEPVTRIGADVRMRYIEAHRRRMGLPPGADGREARRSGDRAAHRGRPLVDAWLYETGQRKDEEVYEDLYGIPLTRLMDWKGVPEVVEVCGHHASLKSDSGTTTRFEGRFRELFDAVAIYGSSEELAVAFKEEKVLIGKYTELQNCYDAIIAANPPRFRGVLSLLSP